MDTTTTPDPASFIEDLNTFAHALLAGPFVMVALVILVGAVCTVGWIDATTRNRRG